MSCNKKPCTDGGNPTKKLNFWATSHFKGEKDIFPPQSVWYLFGEANIILEKGGGENMIFGRNIYNPCIIIKFFTCHFTLYLDNDVIL